MTVSGNVPDNFMQQVARDQAEPLHPDLLGWVEEDGLFGRQLRHPLVYSIPLFMPGQANRTYAHKREVLAEALELEDWGTVVFTHERAYRLKALIEYVIGEDEDGHPFNQLGKWCGDDLLNLVADVWVDCENIEQNIEDWRILFGDGTGFFLGTYTEQQAFAALPDPIRAYRAGIDDGDWSWSTDVKIAEFFAQRFQKPGKAMPIVERPIPKDRCFGYLTRRGESELLVRLEDGS